MSLGGQHSGLAQRVVLLRHGETEWSRSGQHTGLTDIPLTDAGRAQARRAAGAVAPFLPARVLVSPLRRAMDTAALAGLHDLTVCPDLVEWDYGEYEGLTTPQIRERRPGWDLWDDGCPGGEDAAAAGARTDRVVAAVRELDGDVVVVAQGHVLRVLTARWLGLPPREGRLFMLNTATLSILAFDHKDPDEPAIRLWNDDRHLQ